METTRNRYCRHIRTGKCKDPAGSARIISTSSVALPTGHVGKQFLDAGCCLMVQSNTSAILYQFQPVDTSDACSLNRPCRILNHRSGDPHAIRFSALRIVNEEALVQRRRGENAEIPRLRCDVITTITGNSVVDVVCRFWEVRRDVQR